jgi:hypothetical protein
MESNPKEFYLQKMLEEVRGALRSAGVELSAEQYDALEKEYRARCAGWFAEEWFPRVKMAELRDFIDRLLARQGTRPPDFESLYNRKDELDRKFLSGDAP